MLVSHLTGTPFFFRLRPTGFDIACPRCDTVQRIRSRRTPKTTYDASSQRFTCPVCYLKLQLGCYAYPVSARHRPGPPDDTIPSPSQSAQLRDHQKARDDGRRDASLREALLLRGLDGGGGLLQSEALRHKPGQPVNVIARGECRCRLTEDGMSTITDPKCPAHGSAPG